MLSTPAALNLGTVDAQGGLLSLGATSGLIAGATLGSLTIESGATVNFSQTNPFVTTPYPARLTHAVNSLTLVGSTATLDIGNHQVLTTTTNAASVDRIKSLIASAYNESAAGLDDGMWDGKGITSSLARGSFDPIVGTSKYAVGYANGGDASVIQQQGNAAGNGNHNLDIVGLHQTLIRSVLTGDANMDGKIDIGDLQSIFAYNYRGLGNGEHGYTAGDLNHDGVVDSNDILLILASNYNGGEYYPHAAAGGSNKAVTHAAVTQSLAKAAAAPAALTSRNASPATSTNGHRGDGNPDLYYEPLTGDVTFHLDGKAVQNVNGLSSWISYLGLKSAAGRLIPGALNSAMSSSIGAGVSNTDMEGLVENVNDFQLSYSPAKSFSPGDLVFDFGNVLPQGLRQSDLTSDLTIQYQIANAGLLSVQADIVQAPEPSGWGLLGLGLAGLMRRRRETQPRACRIPAEHPRGARYTSRPKNRDAQ
jgi:MYXO-CTERM domain-containing protein